MTSEFPSSSSHFSSIPNTSSAECAVCGDQAWSYRHGAAACLGCTVFFRRAIANKTQCRCLKDNKCEILRVFRGACRYCRLQKCLRVGLQPESVNRNGATGIIDKKSHWKASAYENDTNLLKEFVAFQNDQHQRHFQYFADHKVDIAFRKNNRNCITSRRRAQALDISIMLKLGLEEATEFGNQLKPFKKLSEESKKSVLAEYFLAFLFIDQSLKTSKEPDQGMWLLQNESFMHRDYFFGLPEESSAETTVKNIQSRLHFTFVMELLNTVANPFWRLKIDETECVALKILMMLKRRFLLYLFE
ncbi:hypothetical protein CAEBREN_20705 [Caenorhabditis brenneri]|uniref:Nuclear receptor domain-containing protein n=1 Tax=Caenorhabditis brenneri TaxID=135651 RepID=G0MU54_CAEBE|nr:hypothetical protein CAEBREN_20705 [Caenorhabditis brenneri]